MDREPKRYDLSRFGTTQDRKFLSEINNKLSNPLKPPTFIQQLNQQLHIEWQEARNAKRAAMAMLGSLTTSLIVSLGGVASVKMGEIFSTPSLIQAGKLVTLTAAFTGMGSVTVIILALTYFEERSNHAF